MTEFQMSRLDGKFIKFKMYQEHHSIRYNVYEGKVYIENEKVNTYRDNKLISKEHVGFYLLHPRLVDSNCPGVELGPKKQAPYFDFRQVTKCMILLEVEGRKVE